MKSFAVAAALVGAVAAVPQAVTSAIAPSASAPAGCSPNYSGTFELYVVKAGASNKVKREDSTPLVITLKNGVLTDAKGRTGYIAANNQFQFDGPVQAGAIYTAGWSVCQNTSLALGGSTVFYQCMSGNPSGAPGGFYNLYDENSAAQCSPIEIQALGGSVSGAASQQGDGQVTAGQAHTVICQIGDGQVQQNTCITTMYPITQIGDGQIQAPTGTPVGQISDGQIQAPTGSPVGQISDGQIQAPTATPVGQISDGQIQASGTPVGQISDGQVQATATGNSTVPVMTASSKSSAPASAYTGAAATMRAELLGLAAGLLAVAAL